jgi:acyl-[acyl carrier protein]--UDP-N-acetylglucosamine O-acyltransferase
MPEPLFVHPTASIGGPPEHRKYIRRFYEGHWATYGAPFFEPLLEDGVIVHEFCTINAGYFRRTGIGAGSFLMARVHVGHDVLIGQECEIGAGVVICGEVEIGDRVQIGGNTWIKPMVKIGSYARIGGGSVVVKDVSAGVVVAGNPAKPLTKGREAESRGQTDGELIQAMKQHTVPIDHDHHFHIDEEEAQNALAG